MHGFTDGYVTKLNSSGAAILYSTFLGGSGYDGAYAIRLNNAGDIYLAGATYSSDFPTKHAIQAAYGGYEDGFVSKLNPSGAAFIYSSYLGGTGQDYVRGLAVDSVGAAFLTGATASSDFPTTGAIQPSYGGSGYACCGGDAFITKLDAAGSGLLYSTFLGGSDNEEGKGIAVDSFDNAWMPGDTRSSNFPTKNPI